MYLSGIQRSQLGVCAFQTTHSCISLLIQGGPSPTRSQTLEGTVSRTTRPACLWAAPQAQYVGPQGLSRTKTGRAPSSHGTGVRGPHVTRPTPWKGWQSLEWNRGPLALGPSSEGPLLPPPGPSLCFLDHLQLSMCHLLWPLWPLITSPYIAPTAHPGFHLHVAVISRKHTRTSESGQM